MYTLSYMWEADLSLVVGLYCAAYHSHMPQMKQVLRKFEVEDGDLDCVLCAG